MKTVSGCDRNTEKFTWKKWIIRNWYSVWWLNFSDNMHSNSLILAGDVNWYHSNQSDSQEMSQFIVTCPWYTFSQKTISSDLQLFFCFPRIFYVWKITHDINPIKFNQLSIPFQSLQNICRYTFYKNHSSTCDIKRDTWCMIGTFSDSYPTPLPIHGYT